MAGKPKIENTPTPGNWSLLEKLYFEGLHLEATERTRLLERYRAGHGAIIAELEALWDHEPHHEALFDALPSVFRTFWDCLGAEKPPTQIGPYQVVAELGRGGMGIVYRAKQPPPLCRDVAVKVLPAALHLTSWRKRFEIEQKTLSYMSHPNIATIHDAGVTAQDRPYLVMELLEGLPITRYCDVNRLSIDERLDLFAQVCEGVNHAHRKGMIHLDLKPNNVLVVKQDGSHLPKIIDFGIAGAIDAEAAVLDDHVLGTPAYMSPEQAARQKDKIDIRSDIYSLGSLLFELLLGKPPLYEQFRQAVSMGERRRIVVHGRPESLARQADLLVTQALAAARATTCKDLKRKLSAELDWITAKALCKSPGNRYESCSKLVEDLLRYRVNQPVSAAPEQTWYPLKKWLANHRLLVGSGLSLLTMLVLGLMVSLLSLKAVRASRLHLRQVHDFSESIFQGVGPYYRGRQVKVVELLDEAARGIEEKYADQPELEISIRLVLAGSYRDLGLYEEAEKQFARALEIALAKGRPDDLAVLDLTADRAFNLFSLGRRERALNLYQRAAEAAVKRHGENHAVSLKVNSGLAYVLSRSGFTERAKPLFERTLKAQTAVLGPTHPQTFATLNNFGDLLLADNQFAAAERLLSETLTAYKGDEKKPDPFVLSIKHNLALAYSRQGRLEEAIELNQEVRALRNEVLGADHPDSLTTVNNLATDIGNAGTPRAALKLLRETLAGLSPRAETTAEYLRLRHNLGHFLKETKALARAEFVLRDTWQKRVALLTAGHPDSLKTRFTLGEVLWDLKRRQEALALFHEVVQQAADSLGEEHQLQGFFQDRYQKAKQSQEIP